MIRLLKINNNQPDKAKAKAFALAPAVPAIPAPQQ